jgi:aminoglycoside 6'-N-acetyltransferase I
MRARLWPGEDAEELAREAHAFAAGDTPPTMDMVFLAEDDEARPVGFLELSLRDFSDGCDSMPVPHVEAWYVEHDARGRGLGRALVRAAEEWAKARGFRELASDAELSNERSHLTHQACGFEEVDRLIKYRKRLE